jgi:predicted transposase YdaD
MPKPFDSSMKMLVEEYPADWVAWLGHGRAPVEVIDADLATVSAATDKVVRVGRGRNRWLLLVEMLASYKSHIPERTHWHSTLLSHRHGLPVRAVIVLLRPEADGAAMTGTFERACADEDPYELFRYRVVRLWQIPMAELLRGGLGLLPLATVANVAHDELPAVVHRLKQRIEREVPEAKSAELLALTYVLMGLRYDKVVISALRREVLRMEESITYQEIVGIGEARGRIAELRDVIVRMGRIKFGKTNRRVEDRVRAIEDRNELEALADRLVQVDSWGELFESR